MTTPRALVLSCASSPSRRSSTTFRPFMTFGQSSSCLHCCARFAVSDIDGMWHHEIAKRCRRRAPAWVENLELVLLELNPHTIDRATGEARRMGIADRVRGELAGPKPLGNRRVRRCFPGQSQPPPFVELEQLYDEIQRSLAPDGVLLVNDMIGRNGHRRWPEAGLALRRIWKELPERYRYNPWARPSRRRLPGSGLLP